MKQLLQTLWSKDYLTDEHLTGFDNYKVSLTVALPQFIEFHFFFFFRDCVCVEWIFYPYLTHGALVIFFSSPLLYIGIQLLDNLCLCCYIVIFFFCKFYWWVHDDEFLVNCWIIIMIAAIRKTKHFVAWLINTFIWNCRQSQSSDMIE